MTKRKRQGPHAHRVQRRLRRVFLGHGDSGSMASSWTDYLVLSRERGRGLVVKLERKGIDAIPEEEWDAETWADLFYEADVELESPDVVEIR